MYDLDPKVKVIGKKAGICDGVPSTAALVHCSFIPGYSKYATFWSNACSVGFIMLTKFQIDWYSGFGARRCPKKVSPTEHR